MNTGKIILKCIAVIMCVALCVMLLCGCNMSGTSLPAGMDPDKTLSRAQEIAMSISKGEFDSAEDSFSEEMKAQLSTEDLNDALEKMEKKGAITKYLSWSMRGASDDEAGEYAVVVLVCKCENGSATFTICLNKDSKICGLSMN
ncbi:MAG: DUF3887 domain-containing protein [Ruminococcus sp.]|nr:DUF3887 domain-containing protein [Ruminococcus sp.]